MDENQQYVLKTNLEVVIIEAFDRAALKKFKELNFVFSTSHTETKAKRKLLDSKLEILKQLDVYSKTFLSIHTRAKIALREIQNNKREGIDWAYLELVKMILTLTESIAKKKSVGIREKEKHEWELMEVGEQLFPDATTIEESVLVKVPERKIKYLKEGETGHERNKIRNKTKKMISRCSDIEL